MVRYGFIFATNIRVFSQARKLNNYQFFIIVSILAYIAISLGIHAHGAEFKYNMTKRMQQETAVLPLCITNNTLGIGGLDKICNMIYGGVNTTYGDKLK